MAKAHGKHGAQSAMEYLMTYGWAILVIAVVLGALFGLGIFNGAAALGNGCLAQSGYFCQGAVLSTNGVLSVSIGQVASQEITVVKVGCSNTSAEPSQSAFATLSPALVLQSGQISKTAFHCILPTNTLGTSFVGTLWILYNNSQYPGVSFPAEIGTISERAATLGNSSVGGGGHSHGGGGSISCGTPPVTGQSIGIVTNSTMAVGIPNDVNTSICAAAFRGPQPDYVSPITYSWSTTGSCPGWSNPGNVDNYTYTPSASSSTCTIDLSVTDTSGDSGSGSVSVSIVPAAIVLASGQSDPLGIAVYGGTVYWVNSGSFTIDSVPVGGGRISTLATSTGQPTQIVTDGVNVYWITNDGTIESVPVGGGGTTTLAAGFTQIDGIATDGTNVYIAYDGNTIGSVPVNGGLLTVLSSGYTNLGGIATDGTNVYFADSGAGDIYQQPVGGGRVTMLASGQSAPAFVLTDGRNVYWNDYSAGTLESVPVNGGTVTTIASGINSYAIATDGRNVYFASNCANCAIQAVATIGGPVSTLTQPQDSPEGIATDGTNIYWTDIGSGNVLQDPV